MFIGIYWFSRLKTLMSKEAKNRVILCLLGPVLSKTKSMFLFLFRTNVNRMQASWSCNVNETSIFIANTLLTCVTGISPAKNIHAINHDSIFFFVFSLRACLGANIIGIDITRGIPHVIPLPPGARNCMKYAL